MRKNLHGKILKEEPKEQHLSTIPKSYSFFIIGSKILGNECEGEAKNIKY